MTFKRNDEIKAGIVAYLKSKTTITALVYNDDPEEIKEVNWQGTGFHYPGIRVRIIKNEPTGNCDKSVYSASILCYSELASSQEADQIAGIIGNILHNRGFESVGVKFTSSISDIIPAIRQDERTWRSEILVNGSAS